MGPRVPTTPNPTLPNSSPELSMLLGGGGPPPLPNHPTREHKRPNPRTHEASNPETNTKSETLEEAKQPITSLRGPRRPEGQNPSEPRTQAPPACYNPSEAEDRES